MRLGEHRAVGHGIAGLHRACRVGLGHDVAIGRLLILDVVGRRAAHALAHPSASGVVGVAVGSHVGQRDPSQLVGGVVAVLGRARRRHGLLQVAATIVAVAVIRRLAAAGQRLVVAARACQLDLLQRETQEGCADFRVV